MAENDSGAGGIPKFDCKGENSSISQRWRKWCRAFDLMCESKGAMNDKRKKALLLHTAGMDVQDIFYALPIVAAGQELNYRQTLEALEDYFIPKGNVMFERHEFRKLHQGKSESVDQFLVKLRAKAGTCEFGDFLEDMLSDQFLSGCCGQDVKEEILRKSRPDKLPLEDMIMLARSMESAKRQAAQFAMHKEEQSGTILQYVSNSRGKNVNVPHEGKKGITCFACGKSGHKKIHVDLKMLCVISVVKKAMLRQYVKMQTVLGLRVITVKVTVTVITIKVDVISTVFMMLVTLIVMCMIMRVLACLILRQIRRLNL